MSIASEITRLQNAKAAIKAAIEAKGVTVGDETLDEYSDLIEQIVLDEVLKGIMNKTIDNLSLPDGITSIPGYFFFSHTNLISAEGSTIDKIETRAFQSCTKLTSINFPNLTGVSGVAFAQTGLVNIVLDKIVSLNTQSFIECKKLVSVDLADTITTIGSDCFKSCNLLQSVTIRAITPPTLGSGAFDSNASGRKIYVPSASVNAYKTATNWSAYAADIEAIPTNS